MTAWISGLLRWGWIACVALLCLLPLDQAIQEDRVWLQAGLVMTPLLTLWCFFRSRRHWQLLYPTLLSVWLSLLLPLAYSLGMSASNASAVHPVPLRQYSGYLQTETFMASRRYPMTLYTLPDGHHVIELTDPLQADLRYHPDPIRLVPKAHWSSFISPTILTMRPGAASGHACSLQEQIQFRDHLRRLSLRLPAQPGHEARLLNRGEIGAYSFEQPRFQPLFADQGDDELQDVLSGHRLVADRKHGFYQEIDSRGFDVTTPSSIGFYTYALAHGWQNIQTLFSSRAMLEANMLATRIAAFAERQPFVYLLLMTFGGGLLSLMVSSVLAGISAGCLQWCHHPIRWLRWLVLPAALPLAFQALIFHGLSSPLVGDIPVLLGQLLGVASERLYFNQMGEYSLLVRLVSSILILTPLLTLWFQRLQVDAAPLPMAAFVVRLWPQAKPSLVMLLILLLLGTAFEGITEGLPLFRLAGTRFGLGLSHTLPEAMQRMAMLGEMALASTMLVIMLPLLVGLSWWRYRALQTQPLVPSAPLAPATARPAISLLSRFWLGGMIGLGWLPLVLLMLIAFRQGWFLNLQQGESAWAALFPTAPTLDHFRAAFGMATPDFSGELSDPAYPFLRWVANTLLSATGASLLALSIALPAAYALARYEFRARPALWRLGILIQPLTPALVCIGTYQLYGDLKEVIAIASFPRLLIVTLICGLAMVPLALFPIATVLRQLPNGTRWRQCIPSLQSLLPVLALLLFIQQIATRDMSFLLQDMRQANLGSGLPRYFEHAFSPLGDFAAVMLLLAIPLMVLFYWLIPRINRNLVNHWRPM